MLLLLFCLLLPDEVLVFKNGKKMTCTSYTVEEGRVIIDRNGEKLMIPEKMVDWDRTKAEKNRPKPQPKKKKRVVTGARTLSDLAKGPEKQIAVTDENLPGAVPAARDVTIRFDRMGGNIIVPVTINGRGPYNMVLDTGASGTIISSGLARELNVTYTGEEVLIVGVGDQTIPAKITQLNVISLGGAAVGDFRVVVRDIGTLNQAGVVGLLGQDYLDYFDVKMDNQGNTITLLSNDRNRTKARQSQEGRIVIARAQEVFSKLQLVITAYQRAQPGDSINGVRARDLSSLKLDLLDLRNALQNERDKIDAGSRPAVDQFLNCYNDYDALITELMSYDRTLRTNKKDNSESRAALQEAWDRVRQQGQNLEACEQR